METLKGFSDVTKRKQLPITILVSDGERVDHLFTYKKLGYDPIIVPTIPYSDRSDKLLLQDGKDGEGYIPTELEYGEAYGLREKVRSLRMSWMFTLDVAPISVDLNCIPGRIICERRAVPLLDADELKRIIEQVLRDYPDTDVIRLFDKHTYDTVGIEDLPDIPLKESSAGALSSELPAGKKKTRLSPWCDGSYALFIHARCEAKLAEIFKTVRMPVDTAVEYASASGRLNVRKLNINAFIRQRGDKNDNIAYTYCVQLSSYSRPMQLLSQVMSLKEQLRYVKDQSRVFINIVLRGYDRSTYMVLRDRINMELKHVKHKVTARPNRTQILNFTETPKGYNFYLKIDDDDFYDPLYLASTIAFHDKIPSDMCSGMSGISQGVAACMKSEEQDRSIVRYDKTGACENTLVFSQDMIGKMLSLAANEKYTTTSGKASDAIPMRTISRSLLGVNRYEYWRYMSVVCGRNNEVFSILNYEGSAHATGQSNYGAFASTAGGGAAEYHVRVFDVLECYKSNLRFVRESFTKYNGIDVAIVTDLPDDETGMYIPMRTSWCSGETAAAQPIKDITYEDNFISSFTFSRTGTRYVYEKETGLMIPETYMIECGDKSFSEWVCSKMGR